LDKAGKYFGLLHLNQIRRIIYEKEVGRLVIVEDIAVENIEPLRLDTDLSTVMTRFAQLDYPELPVVDADSGKVLGLLRRQDLLAAYNVRLAEMQAGKP
jgi:CBS domain-containing protein